MYERRYSPFQHDRPADERVNFMYERRYLPFQHDRPTNERVNFMYEWRYSPFQNERPTNKRVNFIYEWRYSPFQHDRTTNERVNGRYQNILPQPQSLPGRFHHLLVTRTISMNRMIQAVEKEHSKYIQREHFPNTDSHSCILLQVNIEYH